MSGCKEIYDLDFVRVNLQMSKVEQSRDTRTRVFCWLFPYHVFRGGTGVDELKVGGRVLHHDARYEAADAAEAVDAARHRRHGGRDGQGRSRAEGEGEDHSGELHRASTQQRHQESSENIERILITFIG